MMRRIDMAAFLAYWQSNLPATRNQDKPLLLDM